MAGSRSRTARVAITAGLTALGLALASPGNAMAATCGQVITANTTLTGDLVNCPGDGLVIGRNGITLNLNGRLIDGVGLGAGIRNNGFDDVRIVSTAGTARVQEFDRGLLLQGGTLRSLVERITWRHNEFAGLELNNTDSSTIRTNTIQNTSRFGLSMNTGSASNVVSGNTITLNGQGVQLVGATANRLESNNVSSNSDAGIELAAGATGNTLLTNTIRLNGDTAVTVLAASNRLERNTLDGNGDAGIHVVGAASNQLLTNTIRNSSDAAIALENASASTVRGNDVRINPRGIDLKGSVRNRLESNNATSVQGRGIALDSGSTDNDLILNTASSNQAEGIYVSAVTGTATGNLLDRNTASANRSDGLHVSGSGHTIRGNIARNNDGWGIYAAPGNVDGGSNRASGNTEAAQCFNVRCVA
jgi:parallel beta-helix repeat protein